MRPALVTLALTSVAWLLACSMRVSVDRMGAPTTAPHELGCAVAFHRESLGETEGCRLLGRVRLRDTGFSVDCGSDTIREELRSTVCELGGNRAVLHRVPSAGSTCVHEDAEIYWCAPSLAEPQ